MTLGRSFGPMKISARMTTTASSLESIPNISALQGLAGFVVPRGRRHGIVAPGSHVDRIARSEVVAEPRRLGTALLVVTALLLETALVFVAALLFLVLVSHPLLETLEALGDVA